MIGNITISKVLKFTLPTITTTIIMMLYVTIDGIFVANVLGTNALAAVNLVFPLYGFAYGVGYMMGSGGIAICATLLGRTEKAKARSLFSTLIIATFIISLVLATLILSTTHLSFPFLGITEETVAYASDYFFYMAIFVPTISMQCVFYMAFIAAGRPRLCLVLTTCAGVTNVLLDYVFMVVMDMGIAGAGIATGFGTCVMVISGLIFFFRKTSGDLHFARPVTDFKFLGKAMINGSSEMLNITGRSVIILLMNIAMLNLAGPDGVAAITAILYTQSLLTSFFFGFSDGIAPVVSFNNGAKNACALRKLMRINLGTLAVLSIASFLVGFLFVNQISAIFGANTHEVENLIVHGMHVFAFSFLFAGLNIFASSTFTAYSNGKISALISFVKSYVFTIAALLILPAMFGLDGVFVAVPIAEFLSAILAGTLLFRYRKKYMYA